MTGADVQPLDLRATASGGESAKYCLPSSPLPFLGRNAVGMNILEKNEGGRKEGREKWGGRQGIVKSAAVVALGTGKRKMK